jgi:6-phosphogluconolactonase (cycloisomerase 2 family)
MKLAARLTTVGALSVAAAVLIAAPASASAPVSQNSKSDGAAVFVQSDNPAGNTVVAYDRAADGSLRQAGVYPTGGLGGVLAGSAVDHLASQGSLAYDRAHGLLYAVNAGSDTITVFAVHGDRLQLIRVLSSGGTFPVSITVHDDVVYVLNARDGASIQGYLRIGDDLVSVPAWHRALGLDPMLTPEFTHTPGQVAFTPDGRQLVVTTKANGNDIDVFAVDRHGAPSAAPTVNAEPNTVPFAIVFDHAGHLLVAEAGTSALASFALGRDGTLTALQQVATGQAATCWVAADGTRFFTSNAGSASLSGYRERHSTLTALGNTATDPGTVDATVSTDRHYLYVQTGAKGVVDAFRISDDGSLTALGSVTVPDGAGGEGIAAT